jgi:hypothetical protein
MVEDKNKEKQLANLSTTEELKGHLRSLKHGVYSPRKMIEKQKKIKKTIMELSYIKEQDEILIDSLIYNLSIRELIMDYLNKNGLFKTWPKNEIQPVMKVFWTCLKEIRLTLGALGMTPLDRARLGLDIAKTLDFAKVMQELHKEEEEN